MYCLRCRAKTGNVNEAHAVTKNNRKIIKSQCAVCGSVKCKFVKVS